MGLRIEKRRRRECKTDYKLRKNLLVSGTPRIVIRATNKYFIVQAVESTESQDKVLFGATSKELLKNGWTGNGLNSIPAGYLTGKLVAKKADKNKKFIIDLGMARVEKGCRVYSVVKGLIDGGLEIPFNEEVFPSEERINGEHLGEEKQKMISKVAEKMK